MILDEIIRIHSDLLKRGTFPRRVYLNKVDVLKLYDEIERQVQSIHTLSIVITNKHGIWCD